MSMHDEDIEGGDGEEVEDGEEEVADRILDLEKSILHVIVISVIFLQEGKLVLLIGLMKLHNSQSHV